MSKSVSSPPRKRHSGALCPVARGAHVWAYVYILPGNRIRQSCTRCGLPRVIVVHGSLQTKRGKRESQPLRR